MDSDDVLAESIAGAIASLGVLALGFWCILDDWKDFEKWSEDPSKRESGLPHHGLLGILAILAGLAGLSFTLANLVVKTGRLPGEMYPADQEVGRVARLPRPLQLPEQELAKYA